MNSRFIVCGNIGGFYLATYTAAGGLVEINHGISGSHDGFASIAFDGTTYVLIGKSTAGIIAYTCTASTLDSWTVQENFEGGTADDFWPFNTTVYYESVKDKFYYFGGSYIYSCDASDVTTWTEEYDDVDGLWGGASDPSGNVATVNFTGGVSYSDGDGTWQNSGASQPSFTDGFSGIATDGTTFVVGRYVEDDSLNDEVSNPLLASSTDLSTWSNRASYLRGSGVSDVFYSSDTNYYIGAASRRPDFEGRITGNITDPGREAKLLYADSLAATTSFGKFEPISEIYRSSSFSVIDGYVVMVGMMEFDTAWSYYPRKVRWTTPGTYNNFTDYGSGSGTFPGNGILLDCRTVNHRVVIFESNQISVLSPTGYVSSPFSYEVIADKLYTISNPVVVDKFVYFVANNGLLYKSDGIAVTPLGNAFDISKFDDFAEPGPIWMDYSGSTKSLVIFSKSAMSPYPVYFVSLETGAVTHITLPVYAKEQVDSSDESYPDAVPQSVLVVDGAVDTRIMAGYGITVFGDTPEDDRCHQLFLDVNAGSDGLDEINSTDGTVNWKVTVETGEFRLTAEGQKVHLHEVIVHSYCVPGYENPDVAALVKSTGEDSWRYPCQPGGTITVTDTTCTGVGTVWAADTTSTGGKVADGDAVEDTFTLPWNADLARVYLKEGVTYTPQTAYTTSGKDVVFTTPPTALQDVYAFCENEPSAVYPVGDYIYTDTAGYHRITAPGTLTSVTLDRYLSTGSDTGYFLRAKQLPEGPGETILGIDEELDGVQIRVLMIPRDGGPPEARFTGITVVYTPAGPEMRGD